MLYKLSQPGILKCAFKWCCLVCSVHVNMCIHHGAYVFICTRRSEANISVFLYCFLPYFLRHSLSLNLELTDLSRLAGQHAQRDSPASASPTLALQCTTLCMPCVSLGCWRMKVRSSCLYFTGWTISKISKMLCFMGSWNLSATLEVEARGLKIQGLSRWHSEFKAKLYNSVRLKKNSKRTWL